MKTKYQNILAKLTLAVVVMSVFSCKEKNGLAPEYMPDMYRSPSIEPYVDYGDLKDRTVEELTNKMTARQPVEGTIPRGFTPYAYENTAEGYIQAGEKLRNPIPFNETIGKEGKELYGMFCVQCHGKTGQGDGILVEREKFPPLPVKFKEGLDISEGKMFHTITHGKGLMGPHSSQLNQEERWKLVHYIRTEFMNESASSTYIPSSVEGIEGPADYNYVPTGDLGQDLGAIFNLYEENADDESLPSRGPSVVLEGVYFSPGSYKLNVDKSKSTLDRVVASLNSTSKVKVELSGHTDNGSEDENVNINLSKNRAKSVMEYLIESGVDASKVTYTGFGSSKPIASNDTNEGKAKNRRTEITVIK